MSNITQLLTSVDRGDSRSAERLLPLVYEELRRFAASKLANEKPGQTLQPTALVHEAYVRLVDEPAAQQFKNRRYFFAAAAEAMRRILVEKARGKQTLRQGGHAQRHALVEEEAVLPEPAEDLLALNEALERLAAKDQRKARLVELRFFAGLTTTQAAELLEISVSTAERDWVYARAWLRRDITGGAPSDEEH